MNTITTGTLSVPGATLRYEVRGSGPVLLISPSVPPAAFGRQAVAALRDGPVRVVPAVGRTTPRTVFDRRCAEELAAVLGTVPVEFPGGHNGNLTHPAAYAARLRDALQGG